MTTKTQEIVQINPAEYGLEESKAKEIQAAFEPMLQKMTELEGEFNEIMKLDVSPETCAKAKGIRLKYVKIRTGTAEIHKEWKAFYLSGGRFVDGWKNAQLFASQGKEDKLKAIEEHYERIKAEKIEGLRIDREKALEPFEVETEHTLVGLMSEEVWLNYFNGVKAAHEQKIAAEKKVEADKIAKEKAEKEEQERIRKENEKLKLEAEAKEKQLAEERAKAETERKALEEKARKEREAAEAQARKEAEAKAKIEAELQTKKDAEEKEKQALKEATELELSKGDKEKFQTVITDLTDLKTKYSFKSKKYQKLHEQVNVLIDKIITFSEEKSI